MAAAGLAVTAWSGGMMLPRRSFQPVGAALVVTLLLAAWQCSAAAYVLLKASVAQLLLEHAWTQTRLGEAQVRPWWWADTWPVARLHLPAADRPLVVLAGASGRNLAFGPAHLHGTPLPGRGGNSVIAGHRDTHFGALQELSPGQLLVLELPRERLRYRVSTVQVVHESDTDWLADTGRETLTLLTCYPFDALQSGTPLRYLVVAEQVH